MKDASILGFKLDTDQATLLNEVLIEKAIPFALNALAALAILIFGLMIAGWVKRGVRNTLTRIKRLDPTVISFLSSLIYYISLAVVFIAVLARFGVPTTSMAAVLGGAGLAIALALQGTLGNVASGVMLMVFRPFKLGDFVFTAGIEGTVQDINLFMTEVSTIDNKRVLIPNGKIFDAPITNFTGNKKRRLDILFNIAYDADIDLAQTVIRDIITADHRIHKAPAPIIEVDSLGDFSVNITTRSWVDTANFLPAKWALTKAVKKGFDANGIDIPFPTRINLNKPLDD